MRTVAQLLSTKQPGFNTVGPDTPAKDVFKLMGCINYNHMVVREDDMYLGIICERDYMRNFLTKKKRLKTLMAKDIMNGSLPIVHTHESIEKCMKLMNQFSTQYLPAFNEMDFVGVISMEDLIKEAIFNHDIYEDSITS